MAKFLFVSSPVTCLQIGEGCDEDTRGHVAPLHRPTGSAVRRHKTASEYLLMAFVVLLAPTG
jgi:hypothetical protein